MIKLTPAGEQLILDWEVGGGQSYYVRFCRHPTVPGGRDTVSGITIGIGWDVGAHSHGELNEEWSDFLAPEILAKLFTVVGMKGDTAKKFLPQMQPIIISWDTALAQFLAHTVPCYFKMTQEAFPGVEIAPACVQESLLCLVFNRGDSVAGPRHTEMADIRSLVAGMEWSNIPNELRSMKRLWPDTKGLCDRREAEAKHIEEGLASGTMPQGHLVGEAK